MGGNLSIELRALNWSAPVDLDALYLTIGSNSPIEIGSYRVERGVYRYAHTVSAGEIANGSLSIFARGSLGNSVAFGGSAYPVTPDAGGGHAIVRLRIVNADELGYSPLPGQSVLLEARTYVDGIVATAGVPIVMVRQTIAETAFETSQNMTGVDRGIYQFTIQMSAEMSTTTFYSITARLVGPPPDFLAISEDSLQFAAEPFPVVITVGNVTTSDAVIRVFAGGLSPITGATVRASGGIYRPALATYENLTESTAFTGADGSTQIPIVFGEPGYGELSLRIVYGSAISVHEHIPFAFGSQSGWLPRVPSTSAFGMTLQTDPTWVKPGTEVSLSFLAFRSRLPFGLEEVAVIAYRETKGGLYLVANVTTDFRGFLGVTLRLPFDWISSDELDVVALNRFGERAFVTVTFNQAEILASRELNVTLSEIDPQGNLVVTASYLGSSNLSGSTVLAFVIPSSNFSDVLAGRFWGAPRFAPLATVGSNLTGSIQVPLSWANMDLSVLVTVTTRGARLRLADEFETKSVVIASAKPAPIQPRTLPDYPGGFEAAVFGLALLMVALALWSIRSRSRRAR